MPRYEDACPWCGTYMELNPVEATYCRACFHRADLPRSCCDCASCLARERRGPIDGEPPAPPTAREGL